MSRSGYIVVTDLGEDVSIWEFIRYRGAVNAAIKGKKGQAFLRELLDELENMKDKRLASSQIVTDSGQVCAIGAVCRRRGMDLNSIDPYDFDTLAQELGIAPSLVREIYDINDEGGGRITEEQRYEYVVKWVKSEIANKENSNAN